ncbi:disulfide bond formation protein B [Neptunomonas sp.]|uniref:disulfide bond formation protein B n=1 Tax=Neptunomonas sp. TaxID=1971898 RepID=UPI0025F0132E|nr:disulfide bond formation protein B [Neptunomonas sp.]
MLSLFRCINRSAFFWLAMMVLFVSMESIALYFQYQLDYGPCVLCVHIRAWVLALLMTSILGFFLRTSHIGLVISNFTALAFSVGMLERAYTTLGIERGFVDGSCTLNSGFPSWLALDKWMPTLFEPWEACGYTPELLFGITMAEGLITISAGLSLAMLVMLISSIKKA